VSFPAAAWLLKVGQPSPHVGYGNHRQGFGGVFQPLDDSRRLIFEVAGSPVTEEVQLGCADAFPSFVVRLADVTQRRLFA